MAKKKKKTIKKQNIENEVIKYILSIILLFIILFCFFKIGFIGHVLNNISSFFFGDVYLLLYIFVLHFTFYLVFRKQHKIKVFLGLLILYIALSLIISFQFKSTNILEYFDFKFSEKAYYGGIIIQSLFNYLEINLNKLGVGMLVFALILISIILIIPLNKIKKMLEKTKSNISNTTINIKKNLKTKKIERNLNASKIFDDKLHKLSNDSEVIFEEIIDEDMYDDEVYDDVLISKKNYSLEKEKTSDYFINYVENTAINKLNNKDINYLDNNNYQSKKEENEEENNEEVSPFYSLDLASISNDSKEEVYNNFSIKTNGEDITLSRHDSSKVELINGNSQYRYPSSNSFESSLANKSQVNINSAKIKGEHLIQALKNFDINCELVQTYIGPSVTKFEIKPDNRVKVEKIKSLQDNIQMELSAKTIRIEAPIPGKNAVGVEIPNVNSTMVKMKDVISAFPNNLQEEKLSFVLGKNLFGNTIKCDISKMPHLLIAGSTGSGKSVCINTIICSYLYRTNPDEVKLVLVDPKKVEFTPYVDIPHLLWPLITDPNEANKMLARLVDIMDERYETFAKVGVRNISSYNQYIDEQNKKKSINEVKLKNMPYIIIIIDELADLMMTCGKDVERSIQRITQLARACGMFMIIATQRPSTNVITGVIKSNIPSRISFAVASYIDSRTILDQTGAERLLGNGDMLYLPSGENSPIRIQGVFISDNEIKNITDHVKKIAKPNYDDFYFESNKINDEVVDINDDLFNEVIEYIKLSQKASTSLLQRRFAIGYNRAARIIDKLENEGLIGPANGSKPREVYIKND